MEKYQKYRGKLVELAKRYRDLEKDNTKARQVLVETQDKALRRISELREQCQLEQQAKAHLEHALRLEMDDLQCQNRTLKEKLVLMGAGTPDQSLNGSPKEAEGALINLTNDTNMEENDKLIEKLRREIRELKEPREDSKALDELRLQLETSQKEIQELRKREEENTIVIAENKMMIHSELENKESEVKKLKENIVAHQRTEDTLTQELKSLKDRMNKQSQELETLTKDKTKLEDRLKEVFEEKKTVNNELREMKEKIEKVNNKFRELSEDKTSLQSQNEQLNVEIKKCKDEMNELQKQKTLLTEEIKSIKIVSESTQSDVVLSLQESMKKTAGEFEMKLADLNKIIDEKSQEISRLTESNDGTVKKASDIEKEKALITVDRDTCRSKIESLKNEKRDHEKTLEREIREKNELKAQVTNIIQEIGRLEEQLKEVRNSHSVIQTEKQKLEEKVEKFHKQHNETKSKIEKDQAQKWQTKVKELESKLQEIQCENSQLADRNCLLEESSRRTTDEVKRLQVNFAESSSQENTGKLHELEEKVKTLSDQLTQCTGDHAKLFDEKEQLDHQYRSLQDANEAKEKEKLCLMEDLKTSQDELNSLKAKSTQLEAEKTSLTEMCDNLRVVLENIKKENDEMIKTRDELTKSFENLKTEFEKISNVKVKYEEQMSNMKRDNSSLTEKNKSLKNELDSISKKNQNRLTELENLLKQTHDEKESLTESLHKNATDIEKKMENYEEIRIQNEYLSTVVKQLESQMSKLQEESAEMSSKLEKNNDNERIKDEKVNELMMTISQKDEQLKTIQQLEAAVSITNRELENLNKDLLSKINNLESQVTRYGDYQQIKDENVALKSQKNEISQKFMQDNASLKEEIENIRKSHADEVQKLKSVENDLENEKTKLVHLEKAKSQVVSEKSALEVKFDEVTKKLEEIKKKSGTLSTQLSKVELELQSEKEKSSEIENHKKLAEEMTAKCEELSSEKSRLEKEIESSRSIIRDLNKDFEDHQSEIETLKNEKANFISQIEELNLKVASESELASKPKSSERYEALNNENYKLQESNRELLEKLETLERNSERKISDMTQEIEELQESMQHYMKINIEFNELKTKFETLTNGNNSTEVNGNSFDENVQRERDDLALKLKKIMNEVEDVSNKNLFLEQKVENYLILEQSNERLKTANEKLSRQLDETLVRSLTEVH